MCKPASSGTFAEVIERTLNSDRDLNRASLAARLGLTESTLRGWHHQGREPSFQTVVGLVGRMPERMLKETLALLLQGTKFKVVEAEAPSPSRPEISDAIVMAKAALDVVEIIQLGGRTPHSLPDRLEVVEREAKRLSASARKSLDKS